MGTLNPQILGFRGFAGVIEPAGFEVWSFTVASGFGLRVSGWEIKSETVNLKPKTSLNPKPVTSFPSRVHITVKA